MIWIIEPSQYEWCKNGMHRSFFLKSLVQLVMVSHTKKGKRSIDRVIRVYAVVLGVSGSNRETY